MAEGDGTKANPWQLTTPSGSSEYTMWRDDAANPPAIVCMVAKTELRYQARAIEDLQAWLKQQGGWVPLGSADEQKPAVDGTVEAWGRSPDNPVGRLVRDEEGPSRTVRDVHAAPAGGARASRGRALPAQQPDAREVALQARPSCQRTRLLRVRRLPWRISSWSSLLGTDPCRRGCLR
jgi:hypothetical protein